MRCLFQPPQHCPRAPILNRRQHIYWTLGEFDGVLIQDAPDDDKSLAALLHLGALGNVHTTTVRAFTAAEMDKIVPKVHVG